MKRGKSPPALCSLRLVSPHIKWEWSGSGAKLDAAGALGLAARLAAAGAASAVRSLDMSFEGCKIGSVAWGALARRIPPGLESLSISFRHSGVPEEAAEKVAELIRRAHPGLPSRRARARLQPAAC